MILDSTCWVALQETVKFLKTAVPEGKVVCKLVPGFKNFPLAKQKEIFRLFLRKGTGITLTKECMLIPKKTLSGIVLFHEKG
jgi:cobalamin-dependent methionine synthase I